MFMCVVCKAGWSSFAGALGANVVVCLCLCVYVYMCNCVVLYVVGAVFVLHYAGSSLDVLHGCVSRVEAFVSWWWRRVNGAGT